ncbi:MAG: orotate phosphoribosyltransferase [Anaerolineae bacterium]|nr:orotate phosphoribosyltransferase [Anaerolineae bacterium]
MDNQIAVARALLAVGAVGFSPANPIRFKSGILSPMYVDNRRLPYHPAQWQPVIEAFAAQVHAGTFTTEIIAGVAVGGIPHSAALGYVTQKPSVFIRKEAKEHGTQSRVEGGPVSGKQVLLVEDMVTTGGSSLSAVEALRAEGALVSHLLAIISYGFQEAVKAFAAARVTLHTLTSVPIVLEQAHSMDLLDDSTLAVIQNWYTNPYGWTP